MLKSNPIILFLSGSFLANYHLLIFILNAEFMVTLGLHPNMTLKFGYQGSFIPVEVYGDSLFTKTLWNVCWFLI